MKIDNINKYWVIEDFLYCHSNSTLCVNSEKIIVENISSINKTNKNLHLLTDGVLYELDKKLEKKIVVSINNAITIELVNDYFRVIKRVNKTTIKNELYEGSRLVWSIIEENWLMAPTSEFLFSTIFNESNFFKRDIETGKTLWEFSFSDIGRFTDWEGEHEGKIDGKIIECQGVLVIRITENQLIGIDNKSGKLLWKNQYPSTGFFYGKYQDEFYVMHENFCLLNPQTGKEEPRFPFFEVFENHGTDNYCVQLFSEKYLYTIGRWDLVILQWDKQTGEIVWKHELHPKKRKGRSGITLKGDVLEPVQFANGKLYVLDSTKTLHVFDRE